MIMTIRTFTLDSEGCKTEHTVPYNVLIELDGNFYSPEEERNQKRLHLHKKSVFACACMTTFLLGLLIFGYSRFLEDSINERNGLICAVDKDQRVPDWSGGEEIAPVWSGGNWTYFPPTKSFYLPIEGHFHYSQCVQLCSSAGGRLTSIHSKEENDYVFNISTTGRMDGDHNDNTWIGIGKCSGGNGWCSVDKTTVDYFNWDQNEPNNSDGQENCVELYSDKSCPQKACKAKWNDIDCDWKLRMCVCKRPGHWYRM